MVCVMYSHGHTSHATRFLGLLQRSHKGLSELSLSLEKWRNYLSANSHPQRRRVVFPKALASFFHASPNPTPTATGQDGSNPSSIRSRAHSNSFNGSIPSVEFVSSGAFMFSGPSLNSGSVSHSNSTSRLPSLREGSGDFSSLRRVHSDTFSFHRILVSTFNGK